MVEQRFCKAKVIGSNPLAGLRPNSFKQYILSKTIENIFANPDEARRKGQKARKRCQELYNLEVMEKELIFQIEKLISA